MGDVSILCCCQCFFHPVHVSTPQSKLEYYNTNKSISYFFYPETRLRSLEEIDFIFAKGFEENISYVRAAKALPLLSPDDVEEYAIRYGFAPSTEKAAAGDYIEDNSRNKTA